MDFKTIFLDYFKKQFLANLPINIDEMKEMSHGYEKQADNALEELFKEELITGTQELNVFSPGIKLENHKTIELTEKGIKEVEKKLTDNNSIKNSIEENEKILTVEDLIKKAPKNLTIEEKYNQIKKEILIFFYELSQEPCLLFDHKSKPYTLYTVRGKIREIESKYIPNSGYHLEYVINQELFKNELTTYRYGTKYVNENEKIGIKNFITENGIKYLEENYSYCPNKPLKDLSDQELVNTYGNVVPRLSSALLKLAIHPELYSQNIVKQINLINNAQKITGLNSVALKIAQQLSGSATANLMCDSAAGKLAQLLTGVPSVKAWQNFINTNSVALNNSQIGFNAINTINPAIVKATQNATHSMNTALVDAFQQSTKALNAINSDQEEITAEQNDEKTYTFEGILGQNCGEIELPSGEDLKRIKIKGYKVKDGIKVLRGFVDASKLADFSKADENYQRDKQPKHLKALESFVNSMKTSAKYLPEVTLVARGYQKFEPIKLSGTFTETQQGEIDNLEHWQLTVNKNQLYRIDGNHRLEATKDKKIYIPFSIIVWEKSDINVDDEAFLFYFLNSKAKKLTTEENLKGLVDANTWENHELEKANVLLPYIRHFRKEFESHKLFKKEYYKNSQNKENAKTQILNILEIILKEEQRTNEQQENLSFGKEKFEAFLTGTQEILSQKDRFKYLREKFRCFPQFVFYSLYKENGNIENAINFLSNANSLTEYFQHDSNSFNSADKMYDNLIKL
ncbi:MAG: hypothetical protein PHV37_04465 [Candidatus Gastranaerophilales bacterium]|nr:hypothetical protein [Candidatus Gastranaerophilales bacterium]